jgi:hypothetical protein
MRSLWPILLLISGCALGPEVRDPGYVVRGQHESGPGPPSADAVMAPPRETRAPSPADAERTAAAVSGSGEVVSSSLLPAWEEPEPWQDMDGSASGLDLFAPRSAHDDVWEAYGFHDLLSCGGDLLQAAGADYRNYYSRENLAWLGVGLTVVAPLANTAADQNFQHWYQSQVRTAGTDRVSKVIRNLGDGAYTVPALAGVFLLGYVFPDDPAAATLGCWGELSLRTMAVGVPPMLLMQYALGAERPGASATDSSWKPFQNNHGVSGHAFMGAVPFVCAANMTEDPLWKAAFYFASTWVGISRINDDRHYLSQALLGWWMAYLAASAVDRTEEAASRVRIFPVLVTADGMGAGATIEYRW